MNSMSTLANSLIRQGLRGAVGRTPMIRLGRVSEATGCEILAKAEYANAGGSVKDRAALYLIADAVKRGQLKPGGTVVEGTAGNTGIGLAHLCNALGYKCVIFMPETQSKEKIDLLRVLSATVYPVPAVAYTDPNNYNHQAKRFAEELENSVWTNQFDNTANRLAHYETTGPEIWEETEGRVDAVAFATGTGGTLAGVGTFLKERNPDVRTFLLDPEGSVLYNYFTNGELKRQGDGSITEGIGQGRVTQNLSGAPVDHALHITDAMAVEHTFRLLHEEGFFVGASSGINVAGAVQAARQMGPGHVIVTCLCDLGQRYYAKLFSRKFLESKNLLTAVPEDYRQWLH